MPQTRTVKLNNHIAHYNVAANAAWKHINKQIEHICSPYTSYQITFVPLLKVGFQTEIYLGP